MDAINISLMNGHPFGSRYGVKNVFKSDDAKQSNVIPVARLFIVGQNELHNELLLSYIKKHLTIDGACVTDISLIRFSKDLISLMPVFILLDCDNLDLSTMMKDLLDCKPENAQTLFTALCNVRPEIEIEKLALYNDIHGIFYSSEPIEMIPKGIKAIIKGEIWYRRDVLVRCLSEFKNCKKSLNNGAFIDLSAREKEILALIVAGQSNREIGDALDISFHTVKTHTYNIYKKIGVENRFQAFLWAARYL